MIELVTDKNVGEAGYVYSVSWRASHKDIAEKGFFDAHTEESQTEFLREEMKNGKRIYIDLENNKPAGIIAVNRSIGEISLLYVLPDCWGSGYGRKLLDFAIEKLGAGADPYLVVLNVNARAVRIYEKYGFVYSGESRILSKEKGISELKYVYKGM